MSQVPFRAIARRGFLQGAVALGASSLTPQTWRNAFAALAVTGDGPYGKLGAPNAHGVRLPAGFTARRIALTGEPVAHTNYAWPGWPDGGATFAAEGGAWVYVCNSELPGNSGGCSAIAFNAAGDIIDAYRILSGTERNCAGGVTPWNTWLSCEEHLHGIVWECSPFARGQGIARPALGQFKHEAAVVNPQTGEVYLTEDDADGRLYRFRPDVSGQLTDGVLEAAAVDADGKVRWIAVAADRPYRGRDTTVFQRGEGAWFAQGHLYFCTTADHRVWALDARTDALSIIYDATALGDAAPLRQPDNVTVHERSGDILVAEDEDDLQIVLLADQGGQRVAAPFMQLVGHKGSEVTGPAFSPDGSRLYFSSQRGTDGGPNGPGMTFEVTGPFRRR